MPSTYTLNNGIELIGTGEQSGTWGDTTNTNLELLDVALDGQVTITAASAGSSGSPNSLPITDGSASNGRNRFVNITSGSDLGSTVYYQLTPNDAEKIIYIRNSLNTQDLIVFQGTYNSSNDYVIKNGKSAVIYFNGAGAGAVAANVLSDLQVDALAVDTDTLYVDATNDRVGINESTPLEALHITTSDSGTTISKTVGNTSGPVLVLDNTDDTTNNLAGIQFASSGSSSTDVVASTGIYSINTGRGGTYPYGEIAFYTTDSGGSHDEAMRIDSSQRVLIGHTSALTSSLTPQLQVVGSAASSSAINTFRFGDNAFPPYYQLTKSRSTTAGSFTIVQDDDSLGQIRWMVDDGTNYSSVGASIESVVDGTPGANDTPGRLVFSTTADGSSSSTERMRIDNAGNVTIGAAVSSPGATLYVQNAVAPTFSTDTHAGEALFLRSGGSVGDGNFQAVMAFGKADGSSRRSGATISSVQTDSDADKIGLAFHVSTGSASVQTMSEAMRIDSSQRVLIGNGISSRGSNLNLQVEGTTFAGSSASFTRNSNDSSPPALRMTKSRGTSTGAVTIVQDDDLLGQLQYQGADGTTAYTAAIITGEVDGTPGTTDMPGRLIFGTTADGANSPTERMRIDNAGRVGIGTDAISGYNAYGDGLVVKKSSISGSSGMTVQAPDNAGYSSVYFGRPNDTKVGGLEYSHSLDGMFLISGNSTAMVLDSSQRLLLGYTSNISTAGHNAQIQTVGQGTADYHGATAAIIGFSNNSNGAYLNFASGRSNTAGTYTIVANDDTVGQLQFCAADGTDMASRAAMITVQMDGAPGANDTPGRITFGTTADGASSPTERMRIDSLGRVGIGTTGSALTGLELKGDANDTDIMTFTYTGTSGGHESGIAFRDKRDQINAAFINNLQDDGAGTHAAHLELRTASAGSLTTKMKIFSTGNVEINDGDLVIGTSGHGIDFSATALNGSSELLDDYEEGSWSPEIKYQNATDDGNATNTTQTGTYTKVGNLIFVEFRLIWSLTGTPATDNILVDNLPYSISSTNSNTYSINGIARAVNTSNNTLYYLNRNVAGTDSIIITNNNGEGNQGAIIGANSTNELRGSFTYLGNT